MTTNATKLREIATDFVHPRAATSEAAKEIARALLLALDVVEAAEFVTEWCGLTRLDEKLSAFRATFPRDEGGKG